MPERRSTVTARVVQELRLRGPSSARELRARLGVSPATFTRAVGDLRAELIATGATTSLRYALRRPLPGLPAELPVYELAPAGVRLFATLIPVAPSGWYVASTFPVSGFYPDLPWFFHELRPAGFLGRLAPRQHPELGLPADIQTWSGDHVVRWLHEWGVDTVRAFVLGGRRPVLVKFSPPIRDLPSRRTADLLRCEHHALMCLRGVGVPAATSELLEAEGRVFLEVARFDRVGEGRLGLVSLTAVAAHHSAELTGWTTAADQLLSAGAITEEDRRRIYWLDRFGGLIGNSDRHAGNLSFAFVDGRRGPVAPVYDMLPMAYAVRSGEYATPTLQAPPPTPHLPGAWRAAWAAAEAFWGLVAEDTAIHDELRQAAGENARSLASRQRLLDRLPAEAQLPLFRGR